MESNDLKISNLPLFLNSLHLLLMLDFSHLSIVGGEVFVESVIV